MAISYKELGLVNTEEMFKKAFEGKFAIPAYNFNNMEQLQAIVTACGESDSPFILQVSSGARKYANQTLLIYMAQGAAKMLQTINPHLKFALHLDHGDTLELCQSCIDSGLVLMLANNLLVGRQLHVPVYVDTAILGDKLCELLLDFYRPILCGFHSVKGEVLPNGVPAVHRLAGQGGKAVYYICRKNNPVFAMRFQCKEGRLRTPCFCEVVQALKGGVLFGSR